MRPEQNRATRYEIESWRATSRAAQSGRIAPSTGQTSTQELSPSQMSLTISYAIAALRIGWRLLNLEHAVERGAGPPFRRLGDLNHVHRLALHDALERPQEILRRYSIHSSAHAEVLREDRDLLVREGPRQALDQVVLRADRPARSGRRLAERPDDVFRRSHVVGGPRDVVRHLRVDQDLDVRIFGPALEHVPVLKLGMHGAAALPDDHLRAP